MAFITLEELNTLTSTSSGGAWSTYAEFVDFVADNRTAITTLSSIINRIVVRDDSTLETNIDEVVQDNSDFVTLDAFIAGTIGLPREEIRNVLAAAIEDQTNELLDQNTMKSITLREIFLDLIRNQAGDDLIFDTVPLDDPDEDDRGKYYVEES